MRYCTRCVQPDTRPGIAFDEEGVCPACRYAEERRRLNWDERRRELEEVADYCRRHNVSGYDCIVGVSGGKDSTRQAVYVRDELGLNPLLVCCSYPPEQQTERGARNLSNLIDLGFDLTTVAPAPGVWKIMLRQGFLRYGNWCKSTEMALYASAPRVAIAYQIPVVFLGDNPATSVGELSTGSLNGDANKMKYSNTIASGPEELAPEGVGPKELFWYRYPSDGDMERAALRVVYLGYFFDFNRKDNAEFSMARGLEVRDDPYEDIGDVTGHEALDEDFVIPGQMMKYLKLGFGKVTDQVCEEIRLGRMTREEAVRLVKLYDGKCAPRYLEKFRRYLGLDEDEFMKHIESWRNHDIWKRDADGSWRLAVDFDNNPVE